MPQLPGSRPLAELDDVPWARLRHAYGVATDVPKMLRRLAAGDRREEGALVEALEGAVLHQGQVYSATGPALPFAIGVMLALPEQHEALCCWCSYVDWVFAPDLGASAREDVLAVRAALTEALPSLAALLESQDERLRSHMVEFLGQTGGYEPARVAATRVLHSHWAKERSPVVCADLLRSCAELRMGPEEFEQLVSTWPKGESSAGESSLCELAAAHGRYVLGVADSVAERILLEQLERGVRDGSGSWELEAEETILSTLCSVPDWPQRPNVQAAVEAALFRELSDWRASDHSLLRSVLAAYVPSPPPERPEQLPSDGLRLLQRFARCPEYWVRESEGSVNGGACLVLTDRGLPCWSPKLQAWFEGAPREACVGYNPAEMLPKARRSLLARLFARFRN